MGPNKSLLSNYTQLWILVKKVLELLLLATSDLVPSTLWLLSFRLSQTCACSLVDCFES